MVVASLARDDDPEALNASSFTRDTSIPAASAKSHRNCSPRTHTFCCDNSAERMSSVTVIAMLGATAMTAELAVLVRESHTAEEVVAVPLVVQLLLREGDAEAETVLVPVVVKVLLCNGDAPAESVTLALLEKLPL